MQCGEPAGYHDWPAFAGAGTRRRPPAAAKNVTCLLSNLIALFKLFAFAAEFFWRIFQ